MNSGFGQQKWENLRRGIPIFHIILPVPSEPPLFRGLIQYSASHWCTHPEAPEFHRFLYLFFPALRFWLLFFSVRFPVFACGPVLPFAAARKACCQSYLFPVLWFQQDQTGQAHIFPSAPLFLQIIIVVTNIIHNRLMGQVKNPCSGLINKITVMRNIEDGSAVAV